LQGASGVGVKGHGQSATKVHKSVMFGTTWIKLVKLTCLK